ncbi:MAG TPA: SpoIID/LytB domain-containing protein [Bacteroidetes bacterium]|nr:SpoIID/LytB domain-containing protein [Bacteroidota bacterium]
MRKHLSLLPLFILAILRIHCAGIAPKPYLQTKIPQIKVLLMEKASGEVTFMGEYTATTQKIFNLSFTKKKPVTFKVSNEGNALIVQSGSETNRLNGSELYLRTRSRNDRFHLQQGEYPGDLKLVLANGKIQFVNILAVETYLKGTIPSELGHLGKPEMEALKAQAVGSRTFALRKIAVNRESTNHKNFDLTAGVGDQVYSGSANRYKWSDWAVENTTGVTAVYHNEFIAAFFHSTCGGRTETGKNIFPGADKPYLTGVSDNFGNGDFCKDSPHYRWVESFPFDELNAMVKTNVKEFVPDEGNLGDIKEIIVNKRFESGRIKKMSIYFMGREKPLILIGDRLRKVLRKKDGRILRSTLFKISGYGPKEAPTGVMLIGAGNGHGVGMCQWGAIGMARRGFSYQQILKHYYRGIELKKMY